MAGVPAAVGKVVSEAAQPGAGHVVGDELPPRLGGADGGVEQRFRSPVVGLEEAVGAVQGYRYLGHLCAPTQSRPNRGERWEPVLLHRQTLGQVLPQPEAAGGLDVQGHDHHRPAGDATQLGQTPSRVSPLVNGEDRHGGVNRGVVEGQRLGGGVDRRHRLGERPARAHRR